MFNRFTARYPKLSALVGVNVAAWLLLRVLMVCAPATATALLHLCELPCSFSAMLHAPWTLLLYMWVHTDMLHLLFNMLWLCWFGTMIPCNRGWRTPLLYLCGGICGGVLYAVTAVAPHNQLIGSSAAVIAVAVAATMLNPRRRVPVPFIGRTYLYKITAIMLAMDVLSVVSGDFAGHIAHIGGAIGGVAAGIWLRHARRRAFKPVSVKAGDEMLDTERILAKIRRSGHKSLTPDERRVLFNVSKGVR